MIIVLTKIPFLSLFRLFVCSFVYVLYGSPVYVIIKASIAETLGKAFRLTPATAKLKRLSFSVIVVLFLKRLMYLLLIIDNLTKTDIEKEVNGNI